MSPAIKTVELRKFKHSPSLSQETEAFTADLYLDGRKAAHVSNHGTGGSNSIHFILGADREDFKEFLKAQPPEPNPYDPQKPFEMNEDLFIGLLVEKLLKEKEEQKQAKRFEKLAVKARLSGRVVLVVRFEGSFVEATCKPEEVEALTARINKQYGKGTVGKAKVIP